MRIAKKKKDDNIGINMYLEFFRVAGSESVIRFSQLKIANSRWRLQKRKNHDDIGKNMCSGVFGVADNEFVIRFS